MEAKEYENFMSTSKVYEDLPIIYPALGLNGEAGEVADKVKKVLRDNNGIFEEKIKQDILKELADTLWYIWATADDMGYTLSDVFEAGIKKVKERQETNTVHGSGDDREREIKLDKELMEKISSLPEKEIVNNKVKRSILSLKINDSNETFFYMVLHANQKIVLEFFDDSNNANRYEGVYKCVSRMDGGLIIDFGEETKLNEITDKLNKVGKNLLFYINGIQYKKITYRIIDYYV